MGKVINEVGNKYGRLTVISKSDIVKHRKIYWNCVCDCGNETVVCGSNLRTGKVISCGCAHKYAKLDNLANQKFGKLTVIQLDAEHPGKRTHWLCSCDCGGVKSVAASHLKSGAITNCGCEKTISKGEDKIEEILKEYNIPYVTHKYVNIDGQKFFFDFYVQDQYYIEYDGIQHFQETFFNKGNVAVQKRDLIKTQYCLNNNIPLIRIPYTKFNTLTIKDLQIETTEFLENKNGNS